ncbi:MAG: hypothetical protein NTY34_01025 [Candidatus Omnitrophica bacterium]|nr:hypothetical protein [Candidatus Omnitrophota bacterium]
MLKKIEQFIIEKSKKNEYARLFEGGAYKRRDITDDVITERPFEYCPAWERTFLSAMRHNLEYQFNNCGYYKKICLRKAFYPKDLNSFEDIWGIPYILSDVFKHYDIRTRSSGILRFEFTSSGSSGKKSKVAYNRITVRRMMLANYYIYKALGLVAEGTATNYIMMCVDPKIDASIATSNADVFLSHLAPKKNMFFSLGKDAHGNTAFLRDESVENLKGFIEEGLPIRMLGFAHFICQTISGYARKYGKVYFPKGSYMLYGGGWKNFASLYGPGFDLFEFLLENTNIDLKNVRDVYGLIEHGLYYLECEEHNKHIPNTALVCVRDPRTLNRLTYGENGLLHLYSPIFECYPGISILTTDYGSIHASCPCSLGGPYIKIEGRAGVTKKATCALTAEQYIEKDAL